MQTSRFSQLPERHALSVFFTAGYPRLEDTVTVLRALQVNRVDMVELGFPFSDPVADGPTIQESNLIALSNGMSVGTLFEQVANIRDEGIEYPILLMGYLNPLEQYGPDRFFQDAARVGVDGLILPDMPFSQYLSRYKKLFLRYALKPVFLVTTRTSEERIKDFDAEDPAFLYVLSSDAVTGGTVHISDEREGFFKKLKEMQLRSRLIVGFGVSDRDSFESVTRHTSGAILGSAFLRAIRDAAQGERSTLSDANHITTLVTEFLQGVR